MRWRVVHDTAAYPHRSLPGTSLHQWCFTGSNIQSVTWNAASTFLVIIIIFLRDIYSDHMVWCKQFRSRYLCKIMGIFFWRSDIRTTSLWPTAGRLRFSERVMAGTPVRWFSAYTKCEVVPRLWILFYNKLFWLAVSLNVSYAAPHTHSPRIWLCHLLLHCNVYFRAKSLMRCS